MLGIVFTVLVMESALRWGANRGGRLPPPPVRKLAPPVVVRPEPSLQVVVPSTVCRICGSPLPDAESRTNGVGPECLETFGPQRAHEPNPDHMRWGDEVLAARLGHREHQELLDADFAAAAQEWEALRESRDDLEPALDAERRRRRRGAQGVLAGATGILLLTGLPPVAPASSTETVNTAAAYGSRRDPTPSPTTQNGSETVASTPTQATWSQTSARPSLPRPTVMSATASTPPAPKPTVQPAPPPLSDQEVLRAEHDCVGGACQLVTRADVVSRPKDTKGTRTTVALVRYPDEQYLGSRYGFIGVDVGSRALVPGYVSEQHDVQPPTEGFKTNDQGELWLSLVGNPDGYRSGAHVVVLAMRDYSGLSDLAMSTSADSAQYVGVDSAGRFRWTATQASYDGTVLTTTYGWSATGLGRYEAVACAKSRNGETFTYSPTYGMCS